MAAYYLHAHTKTGNMALVEHAGGDLFLYEFAGPNVLSYTKIHPSQDVGRKSQWEKLSAPAPFNITPKIRGFIEAWLAASSKELLPHGQ